MGGVWRLGPQGSRGISKETGICTDSKTMPYGSIDELIKQQNEAIPRRSQVRVTAQH